MTASTLTWRGDHISRYTHYAALEGMRLAAEHLLAESKKQCPIDERTLQQSAHITPTPNPHTIAVSYDTKYACRQHEELHYRHPKSGKAKYLEDPGKTEEPLMRQLFATHLKRATQ